MKMGELNKEWSEYSSLTVYEAAFMLAVGADPVAHEYRCQCDQEFDDHFAARYDTQELIGNKCEVLCRAIIAQDIIVANEKHYTSNDLIDFRKTLITKNSFLEWCKKHHYSDILLAFNNADKMSKAALNCLPDQLASSESKDWRVWAREFADEFFDNDTANNCRDSLRGYSVRVMEKMQEQKIHGPRGRIDNPMTVQREALQGSKWWANKQK